MCSSPERAFNGASARCCTQLGTYLHGYFQARLLAQSLLSTSAVASGIRRVFGFAPVCWHAAGTCVACDRMALVGIPIACAALQELVGTRLRGRVLLPGCPVTVTHMGRELLLCVEGADAAADSASGFMVGKDTALHVLLGSESMPQPDKPKTPEVWLHGPQHTVATTMCCVCPDKPRATKVKNAWMRECQSSSRTLAAIMFLSVRACLTGLCSSHADVRRSRS